MKTHLTRLTCLLLLGSASLPALAEEAASAKILHVAPTGNDTNPGTKSAPWLSLSKAVAAAQPGDVIYLSGGTYAYVATVEIDKAGAADKAIRIEAVPGERPILDFSSWKPDVEKARGSARGLYITTNASGG